MTFSVMVLICACVWVASLQPTFFAQLKKQSFTKADHEAAKAEFEVLAQTADMLASLGESPKAINDPLLLTQRQLIAARIQPLVESGVLDKTGNIVLSQDKLNMVLSGQGGSNGDLQNLRVQLLNGYLKIGGEVVTKEYGDFYLSADIKPSLTENGDLKLELLAGRIGQLPLPMGWVLKCLPDRLLRKKSEIEICTEGDFPYLMIFAKKKNRDISNKIKQIHCQNQQLLLELSEPITVIE